MLPAQEPFISSNLETPMNERMNRSRRLAGCSAKCFTITKGQGSWALRTGNKTKQHMPPSSSSVQLCNCILLAVPSQSLHFQGVREPLFLGCWLLASHSRKDSTLL
jgi:hypothetical protein